MGQYSKVSLIIPVYNVEKYLARCLESCIAQTLLDLEIICVDDGSTDKSKNILDYYANKDVRVKVIHKKNGGVSAARNTGIDAATGEMIMFLDSDDYLHPKACETVWVESQQGPTDIIVFGGDYFPAYPINEDHCWYEYVLSPLRKRYDAFTGKVLFEEGPSTPFIWHQAFNREFLNKNDLRFDEDVRYAEDILFQMKAFPNATYFSFIEDKLYNYRWYRKSSAMDNVKKGSEDRNNKHLQVIEKMLEYWKDRKWIEKYGVYFCSWMMNFTVVDIKAEELEVRKLHATRLKEMIDRYELKPYLKKMKSAQKKLYKTLCSYV